eukprot:3676046-Rhodomonas_salina.1
MPCCRHHRTPCTARGRTVALRKPATKLAATTMNSEEEMVTHSQHHSCDTALERGGLGMEGRNGKNGTV